jgi:hypothetical protein
MGASLLALKTISRRQILNIQFPPAKRLRRSFGALAKAEVLYGGQVQQGMPNDEGFSPPIYTAAINSTVNPTRKQTGCFPSMFNIQYWIFDIQLTG